MTESTDSIDAIDAIRGGDREAFERLVKKYQRMVEAVAYSASGSRALVDDIVQDTFVTAWRTIDRLRDPTRVRAWLCGIARNLARNARRSRRDARIEAPLGSPTPFDEISERERDREVATALARLPASYREPLVLFYYEHCTVKEVADALAVGEDAVMQRLSRGRRRLGEELATTVEVELERKPSRAGLAACVLALLPFRAATSSAETGTTTRRAPELAKPSRWRTAIGAIAARKRVAGGALACALGAGVVILAADRSAAVAATDARRAPAQLDDEPSQAASPPPRLPEPHPARTERDGIVYGNISPASADAADTCARGARGLVIAVLGNDAFHTRDGELYFEPSPALERAAEAAATRAAETCHVARWPELYVMCEGTLAEIEDGSIACYPYDPFVL